MSETITFKEWLCNVVEVKYPNGRTALLLQEATTGAPVAKASVNLVDVPDESMEVMASRLDVATEDLVFIKDYAESEGMLDALVEQGIVTPTTFKFFNGYIDIPMCVIRRS